jgi:hypothetical protein
MVTLAAAMLALAGPGSVWLSELDLTKATQGWGKPAADKTVDGNPIVIAGRPFAHGFGTHSVGMLEIDLHGTATRFTAWVGIADETKGRGSVGFHVLADGSTVLWESGVMRGGDGAKRVDVPLKGVKRLRLFVDDAGDGFDYDHAVWADAAIEYDGVPPVTVAPRIDESTPRIAKPIFGGPPRFHAPTVIGVEPGKPFLRLLPVSGSGPLRFDAKGLPPGVALDPMAGILHGVPAAGGKYTLRLTASNTDGTASEDLTLVVGDTLALTPPMGWNSYDAFNDSVTESEVLANASYLRTYLAPFGWEYVVIDYRWYDPKAAPTECKVDGPNVIDAFGRLQPAPKRFPSAANGEGFKPLADQIHAMGLRFGIHIMRGISRRAVEENTPIEGTKFSARDAADTSNTCPWCADMYGVRDSEAGQAWYDSIFRQYAAWGLDYVKVDDLSAPYATKEVEQIRRAIDKCGRSIVFSTSPGPAPLDKADHLVAHANLWRVTGDFWDNWSALNDALRTAEAWQKVGGPGHWPDEDMLPLGRLGPRCPVGGLDRHTNFTKNMQVALLTLWAIAPAPLMVDANLPFNDPWTLALLTNDEVLAVNQDPSGAKASVVFSGPDLQTWEKRLANGDTVIAIVNRAPFDRKSDLSWDTPVRDLWSQKDLRGKARITVPAHGARLLLLDKAGKRA